MSNTYTVIWSTYSCPIEVESAKETFKNKTLALARLQYLLKQGLKAEVITSPEMPDNLNGSN